MGRLIDVDKLLVNWNKALKDMKPDKDGSHPVHFESILHELKRIPTVDAVPVKRGKWIFHDNGDATCNQCGRHQKAIWDYDNWQNFCGNCGADMREVQNE